MNEMEAVGHLLDFLLRDPERYGAVPPEGCPVKAAVEVLQRAVRMQELRVKYGLPFEHQELPPDLTADFREVFGRDVPPMTARTVEMRIELVKKALHNKLYYGRDPQTCPCGCGYMAGCGAP